MSLPIDSVNPTVRADALSLQQLEGNTHVSQADKTREVARQFEAVLLRQILKAVHQTGIKGMSEDGAATNDIYFDMMNYHLADKIAHAGGLGLASTIEAQLLRQTQGAKAGTAGEP